MKSFKIVGLIIGLTISALVYFDNKNTITDVVVEDQVGTAAAAPKIDTPL